MHKKLILNKTGGAPVGVLDVMEWWQEGLSEVITAPYASIAVPVAIDGCEESGGVISNGWIYYNGEIVEFIGGVFPLLNIGETMAIVISESITQKLYDDGNVKDLMKGRYAQLAAVGTGSINTTDTLDFATLIYFHEVMGSRAASGIISGSSSTSVGTINYRKNLLTRMVNVYGTLTFSSAQTLANPAMLMNIATLPAVYRPARTVPFQSHYRYNVLSSELLFTDAAAVDIIRSLYTEIQSNGLFNIAPIRPEASITSYAVSFNITYPFD